MDISTSTTTTTTNMHTTNIAIVNEFISEADDYHEFIATKNLLERSLGLIYSYKEVQPLPYITNKQYRAVFTLKGIRHPAQYSSDIE
jgi:hypothetical protein